MIHHVGLEVHASDLEPVAAFWRIAGSGELLARDATGGTGRSLQHGAQLLPQQLTEAVPTWR